MYVKAYSNYDIMNFTFENFLKKVWTGGQQSNRPLHEMEKRVFQNQPVMGPAAWEPWAIWPIEKGLIQKNRARAQPNGRGQVHGAGQGLPRRPRGDPRTPAIYFFFTKIRAKFGRAHFARGPPPGGPRAGKFGYQKIRSTHWLGPFPA